MSTESIQKSQSIYIQDVIEQGALRTCFQPIVSLKQNPPEVLGFEALTRGPRKSQYESPLKLFDQAEKENCLYQMERMARKYAMKRFSDQFQKCQKLFINLDPNIIYDPSIRRGNTIQFMEEFNVSQNQIIFEVTERNEIKDHDAMRQALEHYRKQGFRVAIDDVGTGYSNLELIARLRPEFVKIDMSIVRDIHCNQSHSYLVETISDFANRIDANLIAEGIECKEELEALRSFGIQFGQGYFLGKPTPGISLSRSDPATPPSI